MITVVSGLPRSGTSLLMQMLHAGGYPILSDEHRPPDADNPRGYFELQQVRALERDSSWIAAAEDKAIKVVSPLLHSLPSQHVYRVIFMRRDLDEVLASQERMLQRRGQPTGPDRSLMHSHFARHLDTVTTWLAAQSHVSVRYFDYATVLSDAQQTALQISEFLQTPLDISSMATAVDPALYRQRGQA